MAQAKFRQLNKRSLKGFEQKLNAFFSHPRLKELESADIEVGPLPPGTTFLAKAIRIIDGEVVGVVGGPEPLDFEAGNYLVETSTTTRLDERGTSSETVIRVWQKTA